MPARRSRVARLARRKLPSAAGDVAQLLDSGAADRPARAAAREGDAVPRAPLRAAAAGALPLGRDDSRLHSFDVPAVPAEPAGADVRADVDPARGAARDPRDDGIGELEARHPAVRRSASRQDRRHLQRVRRAFRRRAARRGRRPRARTLSAARRVRALRRQRQAAQESRAVDHGVPSREAARSGSPEARAHWRRDLEVRGAATGGASVSAAPARPFSRIPSRGDARGDVSPIWRVRLSVTLRGVRSAAARGDGERDAGRHVQRVVSARGSGRRCGPRRSVRPRGTRRRHDARAHGRNTPEGLSSKRSASAFRTPNCSRSST